MYAFFVLLTTAYIFSKLRILFFLGYNVNWGLEVFSWQSHVSNHYKKIWFILILPYLTIVLIPHVPSRIHMQMQISLISLVISNKTHYSMKSQETHTKALSPRWICLIQNHSKLFTFFSLQKDIKGVLILTVLCLRPFTQPKQYFK